ncbi:Rne/Rng family ribonuclease [Azospirillum lipoferum]|uniref:Ribonuclease E n=1 Tax=Azospirillum lipoferum (strain 4B) TaxID=862719 RepID=G7Z8H4_AZOL4|nr:ribonuclease E/G [Azospirillum lipoferum]CBS85776.1 Ribonuclease E [Azospirillum lipoferum 4B]
MAKRMLVDATHPEETRVAVVNGNRLEELDFEIASRKQLKGNIYLAKVTRVEPSLQAAFVEYGGNRHGFLAFSEIHPDYYRIPVADREALLAEERRLEEQAEARAEAAADGAVMGEPIRPEQVVEEWSPMPSPIAPEASDEDAGDEDGEDENGSEENGSGDQAAPSEAAAQTADAPDMVGGDEDEEVETQRRRARPLRSYKIQEVVKRRQVLLVQVTKEERGNKGAALTTYLSLPGRYCVLMPNTGRGGGISRKITNPADRKRLKEILSDLDIPDGMAVILRTAGLERSKPEIKRDLEYLLRLWDDIREQTLKSSAPCLIYEEANLIKRSIRDLYSNDIDEIWVEGEAGFRTAREFMDMLMPGHSQRVQLYRDSQIPLFHRYQVETQIDAIHSPVVQLRSGGYIVINPTEALVSIDVNSGKSTRERNIEETAYKTNLEAADEVARQLRLRDLAGLIVIDFIDMEEPRNNAAVERRMKEAMKNDRARIQLGRISAFGLLELSRQRLRPSLLETNFERCPHCSGTGVVRSVESASLHVLRAIEEEGIRKRSAEITIYVPTSIALYILNQKRGELAKIEERHSFHVMVQADDSLIAPDHRLERNKARLPDEDGPLVSADRVMAETDRALAAEPVVEPVEEEVDVETAQAEETGERAETNGANGDGNGEDRRRRRRRRRGRGRDREEGRVEGDTTGAGEDAEESDETGDEAAETGLPVAAEAIPDAAISEPAEDDDSDEDDGEGEGEGDEETGADAGDRNGEGRKKRRRGKRGGRRRSRREGAEGLEGGEETAADQPSAAPAEAAPAQAPAQSPAEASDLDWILAGDSAPAPVTEEAPVPVPATEPPVTAPAPTPTEAAVEKAPAKKASRKRKTAAEAPVEAASAPAVAEAPARGRKRKAAAPVEAPVEAAAEPVTEQAPAKKASRKRKAAAEAPVEAAPAAAPAVAEAPAKGRKRKAAAAEAPAAVATDAAPAKKASRKRKAAAEAPAEAAPAAAPTAPEPAPAAAPEPAEAPAAAGDNGETSAKPRRGWWKR